MAGVKKTGGGPRVIPRWTVRPCSSCGNLIEKGADASRLRTLWWVDSARRSGYTWVHRAHLFAGGK
jgi:hypothetical protein